MVCCISRRVTHSLLAPIPMRSSTGTTVSPCSAGDKLTPNHTLIRRFLSGNEVKSSLPPATAPLCSFNG